MVQNAARKIDLAKDAVRKILDQVKADKRTSLTAPEGKLVCDAYGMPVPKEGVAKSAGEPPITYVNTVKLGLSDERIHSLILGYWHTIVTPPMVFARNMVEVKKEMEAKGFVKPMVASLAGDVEVEEAAEYLYQNGIPAHAYSTEF